MMPKEVSFWDGLPAEPAVVQQAKDESIKPSIVDIQNAKKVAENQKSDLSPKS